MTYTKEQLADMSGEKSYRKPKALQLNTLSFNGKTGEFIYKDLIGGKDATGKYKKTVVGKNTEVVFLKIRRILSKYRKDQPSLQTNEHTSPTDEVMLYGANIKGIASDIREKYPELRTQQIVYAYLPKRKEVVRFIVKGSSLGSNSKAKNVLGFYEYLACFPKDSSMFEYITKLSPVEEQSDLGSYYAMNFELGEKITDEALATEVTSKLVEVFNTIKEIDEYYHKSDAKKIVTDSLPEDDSMDYPEEEITPDDIFF